MGHLTSSALHAHGDEGIGLAHGSAEVHGEGAGGAGGLVEFAHHRAQQGPAEQSAIGAPSLEPPGVDVSRVAPFSERFPGGGGGEGRLLKGVGHGQTLAKPGRRSTRLTGVLPSVDSGSTGSFSRDPDWRRWAHPTTIRMLIPGPRTTTGSVLL